MARGHKDGVSGGNAAAEMFLNIAEQARATLIGRRIDQGSIGELIELYGCSKKLTARMRKVQDLIRAGATESREGAKANPQLRSALSDFFNELSVFDVALSKLGFMTVDVYYPGLSDAIHSAVGGDVDFAYYYNKTLVPKFGLKRRKLPLAFLDLLGTINGDRGYMPVLAGMAARDVGDESVQVPDLEHLCAALLRCQELIGTIVRENWSFRDVLEHRNRALTVNVKEEVTQVKNQYNIDRSQVGAVGDGAHAHDMTFQQIWSQASSQIDLAALATELAALRQALKGSAKTAEHDAAVGEVAAAETAAKKGDGPSVLQQLKSAGEWVLGVAVEKGLTMAVTAIKSALGV